MSSRTAGLLTLIPFLLALAGDAAAEPPPARASAAPELLWFEVPPQSAAPAVKRTARPRARIKIAAKNRYGNQLSLESLAARERRQPRVDCAAACGERKLTARKPAAPKREKRVSDLTRAVQLYR